MRDFLSGPLFILHLLRPLNGPTTAWPYKTILPYGMRAQSEIAHGVDVHIPRPENFEKWCGGFAGKIPHMFRTAFCPEKQPWLRLVRELPWNRQRWALP
jgi:hypothetical protein